LKFNFCTRWLSVPIKNQQEEEKNWKKFKFLFFLILNTGFFWIFFVYFMYSIQHCFIRHPSDSIVPADAGLAASALTTRLDLICEFYCIAWPESGSGIRIRIKIISWIHIRIKAKADQKPLLFMQLRILIILFHKNFDLFPKAKP